MSDYEIKQAGSDTVLSRSASIPTYTAPLTDGGFPWMFTATSTNDIRRESYATHIQRQYRNETQLESIASKLQEYYFIGSACVSTTGLVLSGIAGAMSAGTRILDSPDLQGKMHRSRHITQLPVACSAASR